jgi:3-oxoacyl-[acyl-carrier protein] reductase
MLAGGATNSLRKKRAFVTGAAQGIGKAIAETLIREGCDVFMHCYNGLEGPQELVELASSLNQRAGYYQADLTVEANAIACVKAAMEFLQGLEILVNNVGGLVARKKIEEIDGNFWKQVLDVNLTTMLLITREAVPYMAQANGASIINIASLAGRQGGHEGSLVYATAKGAVLTWTRALARELGPRGIRVNAVAPGLILGTRFHAEHTTQEVAQATINTIPLGRAGNVYDVARTVAFLASEYNGFITGETIDINGGVYSA